MDIKNIETFIRVAEIGNFSRTAEELGYAQSTVTMQIKQLESEIGVPLFERQGKRVSLSKEGRQFLNYAYHIAKCTAEMKESFSGAKDPTGVLTIGIVESLCSSVFREIFEEYMKQWPDVKLKVRISNTDGILQMLKLNQVDFVIILDKEIKSQELKMALRREENITFFCSKKSRLTASEEWMLQDILNERFVVWERKTAFQKHFDRIMDEKNLHVFYALETGSTDMIVDSVSKNLGISFAPEILLTSCIGKNSLHLFSVAEYQDKLYTQLIYKKDKWLSPAMKEFVDLTREKLFTIL